MSARVFTVENRLARSARRGGRSVNDAVRLAARRVESLRDECVASLDGRLSRLAFCAQLGRSDPSAALDALYHTSDEIYGIAGTFGLRCLGDTAYGFCDLIDWFRSEGTAHWPSVDVHVEGMRLLLSKQGREAEEMAEGLRQVRARYLSRT